MLHLRDDWSFKWSSTRSSKMWIFYFLTWRKTYRGLFWSLCLCSRHHNSCSRYGTQSLAEMSDAASHDLQRSLNDKQRQRPTGMAFHQRTVSFVLSSRQQQYFSVRTHTLPLCSLLIKAFIITGLWLPNLFTLQSRLGRDWRKRVAVALRQSCPIISLPLFSPLFWAQCVFVEGASLIETHT